MGGNAFEETQHLTQQQYQTIVAEIIKIISSVCVTIQPYIPLPQKETHGDIDFLVILQHNATIKDIQVLLNIQNQKFKVNNNQTANSVYRNKQVDFNIAANAHEFQLSKFYKSYGGIGAFLGLFLPSKFVKLNQSGIVCCAYHQHIKLEFLVCEDIDQILIFYGLQPQVYHKGFHTRKDLFFYLRNIRFLNQEKFATHTTKHQTKIMKAFQEHIKTEGPKLNEKYIQFQDPLIVTLKYFKKTDQFDKAWKQKFDFEQRKKSRQNKWNGMHIMNIFKIESKKVNGYKKIFESTFASKQQYQRYIEEASFQQIINYFSKVCQIKPKQ